MGQANHGRWVTAIRAATFWLGALPMFSAQIRRRKIAWRLLQTVGAEVSKAHAKSRLRQAYEIGILGLRGYTASDYYVLKLYKDHSQAKRYMNQRQFDEARRKWNPPQQGIFEFNKWIFGNYCASVGIPTPRCYALFHRQIGLTADGTPLRDKDDLRFLMGAIQGPVVCKPVAGSHGDHVMVFDRFDVTTGVATRASGRQVTLDEVYQTLAQQDFPWLLQAKVRQHPALRELHAASANTARIITLLQLDGRVQVLGAVLRIGVGSAEIDNTTGGGIAAPIDIGTGTCGPAISESTIRLLPRHPDTNRPIEGFVVPFWDRMKQVAIAAHQRLPFAQSLGWDVAFGDDGPVILEVNGSWYHNHIQMTGTSLWDTPFAQPPANPT